MARRKRRDYDEVHNYVERIEDVLLSESSWSTSDSDCSGCLHLSKGSTETESDGCNGNYELTTLSSTGNSCKGMLQQISLLTAGAQPWNYNICTVHGRRFAYAATLVIYVYQAQEDGSEWHLYSILANHRKTITCIHWHPIDEDIIASASLDQCVCVWSVSRQCVIQAINICRVPTLISWCHGIRDIFLSFYYERWANTSVALQQ
ncbi:hypothetical protein Avbf_11065 [Armadillidium vulgare]|nr:hypothetical protein Avbf_11065 [Armadillidium vulgare]